MEFLEKPDEPRPEPEPVVKPLAKHVARVPLQRFEDIQSLEDALKNGEIGSDHHAMEKQRLLGLKRAEEEERLEKEREREREQERQEKLAATQAEVLKQAEVVSIEVVAEPKAPEITESKPQVQEVQREVEEELKELPEAAEEVIVAEVVKVEVEEEDEHEDEIPEPTLDLVEVLSTNHGQFADVQIGRTALGELVGVKKFHNPEDPRFDREIAAYIRLLALPAVPELLESGKDADGKPFFVFEVEEGQRVLSDEVIASLPMRTRMNLAEQLLITECAMNDAGVRHGDWANVNTAISGEKLKTFDFDFSVISNDLRFSTEDTSRQGIDHSLSEETGGAAHRRFETHAHHKGEKLDDLRDRVQASYLASFILSLQTPSIEGWGFLKEDAREQLKRELGKDPEQESVLARYDRLVEAITAMAGTRERRPLETASILKIIGTPEALSQLSEEDREALAVIAPLDAVEVPSWWKPPVNFLRRLIGREPEPAPLPLPLGFVASEDQINKLRRLRLDEQYRRCVHTLVRHGIIASDVNPTMKDIRGEESVMPSFREIWESLNLERLLTLEKYFHDPVLLVVPFGASWEKLYRAAAGQYSTFYASNFGLMTDVPEIFQADRNGRDSGLAHFLYHPHRQNGGSTKAEQLDASTAPVGKRGWSAIIADAAYGHSNRGHAYFPAAQKLETQHLRPLTVEDWLVMLLVSEAQGGDLDRLRHSRSGLTGTVCGLGTAVKKNDQISPLTVCIAPFEGLNIRAVQADSTYDHRITRHAMELI